jgi:CubicO group peptidase (beta-lactamase class C family)
MALEKTRIGSLLTALLLISLAMAAPLGVGTVAAQGGTASEPDTLTSSQCFTPKADAYAWDYFGSNRDQNYGGTGNLDVASLGDAARDRRTAFLRFDLGAIPDHSVVLSATLEMFLTDIDGTGTQALTTLKAVEKSWLETTLTWNNQPDLSSMAYDEMTVTDGRGWKSWDATFLANEWITGGRANNGLALISGGVGSSPAHFYSQEGSDTEGPKLCVEWQRYQDILDLDSVGWASGRNYSSSAFGDWFDQLSDLGYMLVDIEVDEIDGNQRVGGVWQKNTDGRNWLETRNMDEATWETLQQQRADAGYRLIDQEVYTLGSNIYYAGIWIENVENLYWVNYYNVTGAEFSTLFDQYSQMGYMPIDVEGYAIDGELLYSAIWLDNIENLDWYEWRNLSSAEFAEKFDMYSADFRMIDVESYLFGGQQYYAGIWVENSNGRGWAEWRDMTSKQFGEKWAELRDAGYRLIDYEVYPTADGWRYAGVWRQNTDRPDWVHKDAVDTLAQDYFDNANLPGMSVAIAENGQFRYLRGFGYADVDDTVATDSRTIYRLASVSKAVAGVLGLRLSEEGLLDLEADTRDYVPAMPVHHTHTVSQTLSNRSAIGHYSDYPNWPQWVGGEDGDPDHYATALAAAMQLWDAPLPYPPPGSTYKYSSFAYTFTGAAMEGAVGDPISEILEDHLTGPYNLNTLIAEDRSVPNAKRSLLYNSSNVEVEADDLSWKVLGGGLEASAYDLARFGIRVENGTILSQDSLDRLWTRPDSLANYALGWDVGTHLGSPVVAKSGAQNGARSYIRIYPDENIVIVILTNRKTGHNPRNLALQIATLMLSPPLASSSAADSPQAEVAAEEPIDEPEAEGLPAEDVVWPVSNPLAQPSPEDLEEPVESEEAAMWTVYLPMVIH